MGDRIAEALHGTEASRTRSNCEPDEVGARTSGQIPASVMRGPTRSLTDTCALEAVTACRVPSVCALVSTCWAWCTDGEISSSLDRVASAPIQDRGGRFRSILGSAAGCRRCGRRPRASTSRARRRVSGTATAETAIGALLRRGRSSTTLTRGCAVRADCSFARCDLTEMRFGSRPRDRKAGRAGECARSFPASAGAPPDCAAHSARHKRTALQERGSVGRDLSWGQCHCPTAAT